METDNKTINWAKDPTRRQRQAERLRNIMKRLWADPIYTVRRSEVMRKYWDDPVWRERQSKIAKEACKSEQVKTHIRIAATNRWKNPTTKMIDAQIEKVRRRWLDPNQKTLASIRVLDPNSAARKALIEYGRDPNNSQLIIASVKKAREKRWADPKQRRKQSEMMLDRWADDDFKREYMKRLNSPVKKQARSAMMLVRWADVEFRNKRSKALSQSLSKLWLDIGYKEKRLRQLAGGWGRRPTEPEITINRLLESQYPGEFRYNGNQAGVILAGHIPDFVNINGKKQLIELFGCYWHACFLCGYKDPNHVRRSDRQRIKDFCELGWDCLVIWQHELENKNTLEIKLNNFVGKAKTSVLRLIPQGFK